MNLQGKVVIVTGGARGIGSAASKLLAQRGAKVVVNYLKNQDAAEAVVSDIVQRRRSDCSPGRMFVIHTQFSS